MKKKLLYTDSGYYNPLCQAMYQMSLTKEAFAQILGITGEELETLVGANPVGMSEDIYQKILTVLGSESAAHIKKVYEDNVILYLEFIPGATFWTENFASRFDLLGFKYLPKDLWCELCEGGRSVIGLLNAGDGIDQIMPKLDLFVKDGQVRGLGFNATDSQAVATVQLSLLEAIKAAEAYTGPDDITPVLNALKVIASHLATKDLAID